jgi:hypothetical protein
MSLDGSYDMVLLPSRRDDSDGLRLARRWRARRQHLPMAEEEHSDRPRHPPRRRRRRRATMATQKVAPCRLLHQSESTTPALPRGTCRALSSHLR